VGDPKFCVASGIRILPVPARWPYWGGRGFRRLGFVVQKKPCRILKTKICLVEIALGGKW
jgi:hypothetical protein